MLRPYFLKEGLEAGIDEVGRGCLAGPVVAAAVVWPKDRFEFGYLNDSKKVSKGRRKILEPLIKQEVIAYAIGEASSEEIDRMNILNATYLAMHRALESLKINIDRILVDGNRFKPYGQIPSHCFVKGDGKYMSIAASSILAKEYRDQTMRDLSNEFPGYGWEKNVGYPTLEHRAALNELGPTPLHRKSFNLQTNQLNVFN